MNPEKETNGKLGFLSDQPDQPAAGAIEEKLKRLFAEVDSQSQVVENLHGSLTDVLQPDSMKAEAEECRAKCAEDPTNWSPVEGTLANLLVQMERNRASLNDLITRIRL
jgi:hypothetical protein